MNLTLFLFVFVALTAAYFIVGMYASRKVDSEDDYFLAGRRFGVLALTFTLVATQVGAGSIMGAAEESYRYGWWGLLYNCGMCLGFLLLGFGFAGKLRQLQITTTAELFELKFGSKKLRRFASVLSVITLGGILAAQILASRKLMATFVPEYEWLIVGFWLVVIFYTMFGGLKAVVATDIFQVVIIFLVFGGVFAFAVSSTQVAAGWQDVISRPAGTSTISFQRLFSLLAMPAMFSLIEQDLAQRFFSARSKSAAAVSALWAALVIMIFSLIPAYFGMLANASGISAVAGASPLLLIVQAISSDLGLILVVCALIAAISSTADSLLCAIGSNIIYDFNLTPENNFSQSKALLISRGVTLVAGISAMVAGYYFENVLDIMVQSYELSVSCLFVPLLLSFFMKDLKARAGAFAIAGGVIGFFVFRMIELPFPREIATLFLSAFGFWVGQMTTCTACVPDPKVSCKR